MDYEKALEFVERYYTNSWNNLLWLLAVAFGVIGILMPIYLQWLQNRNNQKEIERINKENIIFFEKQMDRLEKSFLKIEKSIYILHGKTFVTQGNTLMNSSASPENILYYFLHAAYNFFLADNDQNLYYAIRTIEDIVNLNAFPKEITNVDDGLDIREIYDQVLFLFEKGNTDGKYSSIITLLKEKIKFKNR